MNQLLKAMQTENTRTENGMVTNTTSLNSCVDFFFTAGAMRKADETRIVADFSSAFNEDALTAMKLLFWARDVRGGAGERRLTRTIYKYLATNHEAALLKNLHLIPVYGRWDDILDVIEVTKGSIRTSALDLIKKALLEDKDALCAKWMPRPNKNGAALANIIRKHLGLDPKAYRKLLAGLSYIVETPMCAKQYDLINYSHVPSLAMGRYTKAFNRNDAQRFVEYKNALVKGEVKINASAVYPYDVVKTAMKGDNIIANEQWKSLPNYMEGNDQPILCMVDTSSSMFWEESRVSGDLFAGHVAQSLAIYTSERNLGPFKDAFLSFNSTPQLHTLNGNLTDRLAQIRRAPVGGSTNLEACFQFILDQAMKFRVKASEMPGMIIILSDMEFNSCSRDVNDTAHKMIKKQYADAGYNMPQIVFWNLASRNKNVPVQFTEKGTALVSGFSPSILTALLKAEDFTPYGIMIGKISEPRYDAVTV
jgi:hypothetical protein